MHDYRSTAKRLRDFFGDSTPVEDVGVNRVNAFREHLLDGTDDAKGVSARTTNKTLTLLHGVFKLAMERHGLASNPVATAEGRSRASASSGSTSRRAEV